MKNRRGITKESFDKLLFWLDSDREEAGRKYEALRRKLIKIFITRGCTVAEDLSDETFNRVAAKIEELTATYVGDPALYFYGVAHNLFLEYLRRKPPISPPPVTNDSEQIEELHACLEQCLVTLTPDNRQLILQYYMEEKQAKIDNRQKLAQTLGIAVNALRIRAHRIRSMLEQCVNECLKQKGLDETY